MAALRLRKPMAVTLPPRVAPLTPVSGRRGCCPSSAQGTWRRWLRRPWPARVADSARSRSAQLRSSRSSPYWRFRSGSGTRWSRTPGNIVKMVWPSAWPRSYPHPLHGLSVSADHLSAGLLAGITARSPSRSARWFRPVSIGWWRYVGERAFPWRGSSRWARQAARRPSVRLRALIGIFVIAAWSAARLVAAPGLKAAVAVAAVAASVRPCRSSRARRFPCTGTPAWRCSLARSRRRP